MSKKNEEPFAFTGQKWLSKGGVSPALIRTDWFSAMGTIGGSLGLQDFPSRGLEKFNTWGK